MSRKSSRLSELFQLNNRKPMSRLGTHRDEGPLEHAPRDETRGDCAGAPAARDGRLWQLPRGMLTPTYCRI